MQLHPEYLVLESYLDPSPNIPNFLYPNHVLNTQFFTKYEDRDRYKYGDRYKYVDGDGPRDRYKYGNKFTDKYENKCREKK